MLEVLLPILVAAFFYGFYKFKQYQDKHCCPECMIDSFLKR